MDSRTSPRTRSLGALARDDRGAVLVEYLVVWGTTIILITFAVVALGPALHDAWTGTKDFPGTQKVLLANKP